jgi:hypothetical protein
MTTSAIRTLKPNVTEKEAMRTFSTSGVSAFVWRMRSGPLRKIAAAYVPFRFYRVRYELGRTTCTRLFALDVVDGSLDLFEFPRVPDDRELLSSDSRNRLTPALSEDRAVELLREKVLRIVFQQGFFKLREPRLDITREHCEIYLPYWLGFYGGGETARCRVLDAVRRRIEGAKASAFFEQWLAA